jgi:hypothetical protein
MEYFGGRIYIEYFLIARKNPTASAGFEPANLGTKASDSVAQTALKHTALCYSRWFIITFKRAHQFNPRLRCFFQNYSLTYASVF